MPLTNEELKLIRAAQSGDEEAWCGLVTRYSRVIWSATGGYNLSFEDREDIVQEVFVRLIHHINSYNPDKAGFTTYITTITKRICIDKLRKRKVHPEVLLPPEELKVRSYLNNHNTNDLQSKIDILCQALEKLESDQRLVIELFYIQGFSYNQISKVMSRDYNWVKNTLHRAREYLRKFF
jgi:RNA polymerase sigma-70 factor (ECF subfamily)